MSGTEEPEPGSVDWDKVVTIDQFLAAARRHPAWKPAKASSWGRQAVIIDAGTDEVLASFDEVEAATRDFYRRMDEDPTIVGYLRLAYVNAGSGVRTLWPSGLTELERAREATDALNYFEFGPAAIVDRLWAHLVRGEAVSFKTDSGRRARRAVELWWPNSEGEHKTIGYLVEEELHQWRLHTVGDGLRTVPLPQAVEEHIAAEACWFLGNPDITAADVRAVRHSKYESEPLDGLPAVLLHFGVELAYRFEVLSRTGDELQ